HCFVRGFDCDQASLGLEEACLVLGDYCSHPGASYSILICRSVASNQHSYDRIFIAHWYRGFPADKRCYQARREVVLEKSVISCHPGNRLCYALYRGSSRPL